MFAASAAHAGAPFQTDDPGVTAAGEVDVLAFYQSTLAGNARTGSAPGVEFHFGLSDGVEVDVAPSLAFSTTAAEGTRRGYGDTTLGLKYRLVEESDALPLVSLVPKIALATGDSDRGLGNGGSRIVLGAAAQRSRGALEVYGNAAYVANDGAGNRNFWFAGCAAQRHLSERWILGAEIFAATAQTQGGRASSGFNVGGYYLFGEHDQALFSAGRGLANVHETNRVSAYVGYQHSF